MHHTLRTLRISNLPRQGTKAVTARRTAALTELRLPLVQPTLGNLRLYMSRAEEDGRGRRITHLMLTCRRYHLHQVICGRRIQCIPLRRASRIHNINPLQAPLTQQSIVTLEALPMRTINSLWQ